jgi:hypothetical protein
MNRISSTPRDISPEAPEELSHFTSQDIVLESKGG